jgi:sodium/potassium-transporting ATPase subunit alpha
LPCLLLKQLPSDLRIRKFIQLHTFDLMLMSRSLLTIKGAPDVLIGRCSKYTAIKGDSKVLDDNTRSTIEEIQKTWSSQGKRVILLARKTICKEQIRSLATSSHFEEEVMHHARSDLILVGIVGIVDPPRDEIPSVVSILRGAGIRIFMVRAPCTIEIILLTC